MCLFLWSVYNCIHTVQQIKLALPLKERTVDTHGDTHSCIRAIPPLGEEGGGSEESRNENSSMYSKLNKPRIFLLFLSIFLSFFKFFFFFLTYYAQISTDNRLKLTKQAGKLITKFHTIFLYFSSIMKSNDRPVKFWHHSPCYLVQ